MATTKADELLGRQPESKGPALDREVEDLIRYLGTATGKEAKSWWMQLAAKARDLSGRLDRRRDPEKFWRRVMDHFFMDEASELEYQDFVEWGEEYGLLRTKIYDPAVDGDTLMGDPEPGDTIYVAVPKEPA